jgi:hypothetical protein
MIRCAILHEFIYRVVHEVDLDQNSPSLYDRFPLDKYLPSNTDCTPIDELPILDDDPESPFRHVVRVPPFKDAQRGWFMVRDILQVVAYYFHFYFLTLTACRCRFMSY